MKDMLLTAEIDEPIVEEETVVTPIEYDGLTMTMATYDVAQPQANEIPSWQTGTDI